MPGTKNCNATDAAVVNPDASHIPFPIHLWLFFLFSVPMTVASASGHVALLWASTVLRPAANQKCPTRNHPTGVPAGKNRTRTFLPQDDTWDLVW